MTAKPESIAIFSDETYPDGTKEGRLVSVAVATPRGEFEERRPTIRALAQLGRKRSNHEIKAFLDQAAFLVSVVSIDRSTIYGASLLEREDLSDVGAISRTDSLWGQGLGYSVGYVVRLVSRCWKLWPITIYYDARQLHPPLQERIEAGIRSIVPRLAAEELREMGRPGAITIDAVIGVRKPKRRNAFEPENDGIWLVDAAARVVTSFSQDDFGPNFLFRDATPIASRVAEAIAEPTR